MKRIGILLVCVMLLLSGCKNEKEKSVDVSESEFESCEEILTKFDLWEMNGRKNVTYFFKKDGTGSFDNEGMKTNIEWSMINNALTIHTHSDSIDTIHTYTVTCNNDSFTLKGVDIEVNATYVKSGTQK